MAWTKYQLFLAGLMLTTGSLNTLSAKWADTFSAEGCHSDKEHEFNHPFVQAVCMFLGEFSCLLVFHILLCHDKRRPEPSFNPGQSFNPLLFFAPAMCDMTATSIMYVALSMTSASSFQMLRGAVIIFTGLLSVAFLGRRLKPSQWVGILTTIVGLVVVGLADFISKDKKEHQLSEILTGDLLIIMAQVIVAVQMVLEEKFVYKHDVHPLKAVGTEGMFGFVVLTLLLIPMYFIPAGQFTGNPRQVLEDALDAFCQIGFKPLILVALLGNTVSIAFFNFAGISVTKEISATTRMVLDSLRTLVIWAVSLALGWETFHGLQVLGFVVLLTGTALYNGLHRPLLARIPYCAAWVQDDEAEEQAGAGERERLLSEARVQAVDSP
ncbi:solute carrier family 35 member F6 [Gadus morhua]|uniref:Solute carrier family 35 member F6 n=1 Tax=Gadus morhua TaxID=8049 RepID=A0A8C4YZL4_GADMO|nr:solute carrier family 35 member F6 [Gadus morhua]